MQSNYEQDFDDEEGSYWFTIMDVVSYTNKFGMLHVLNDIIQRIQYEKDQQLVKKHYDRVQQFEDVPF
jgi:hypothetical protein